MGLKLRAVRQDLRYRSVKTADWTDLVNRWIGSIRRNGARFCQRIEYVSTGFRKVLIDRKDIAISKHQISKTARLIDLSATGKQQYCTNDY